MYEEIDAAMWLNGILKALQLNQPTQSPPPEKYRSLQRLDRNGWVMVLSSIQGKDTQAKGWEAHRTGLLQFAEYLVEPPARSTRVDMAGNTGAASLLLRFFSDSARSTKWKHYLLVETQSESALGQINLRTSTGYPRTKGGFPMRPFGAYLRCLTDADRWTQVVRPTVFDNFAREYRAQKPLFGLAKLSHIARGKYNCIDGELRPKVLFPICKSGHWYLCVADFITGVIRVFDSLADKARKNEAFAIVRQYLFYADEDVSSLQDMGRESPGGAAS